MSNTADNSVQKKRYFSMHPDPGLFEPASEEEKEQLVLTKASVSFLRDAMVRLRRNKLAMLCLCVIILIALIVFIAP